MAGIKQLISTKDLKTTRLAQLTPATGKYESPGLEWTAGIDAGINLPAAMFGYSQLFADYDSEFDALIVSVVPLDTETVVHYVDDHVALLYDPKDLQVVGVQVEDFKRSFLSKAPVGREWRLSEVVEPDVELEDFGDIVLIASDWGLRLDWAKS